MCPHTCPVPPRPVSPLQLCAQSQTCPHPASRQIQLDLPRTLTSNRLFSSPSSAALQQLGRVLVAFSWRNPQIGYCQGLNRCSSQVLLPPWDGAGHLTAAHLCSG